MKRDKELCSLRWFFYWHSSLWWLHKLLYTAFGGVSGKSSHPLLWDLKLSHYEKVQIVQPCSLQSAHEVQCVCHLEVYYHQHSCVSLWVCTHVTEDYVEFQINKLLKLCHDACGTTAHVCLHVTMHNCQTQRCNQTVRIFLTDLHANITAKTLSLGREGKCWRKQKLRCPYKQAVNLLKSLLSGQANYTTWH